MAHLRLLVQPMNIESQRVLRLLDVVEQESTLTQRTLSARLGIALGLTNLYVKRLIRKGYIKCVTIRANRLAYIITPRGLAQKARLTLEFMEYSLDLYRDARRHLHRILTSHVQSQMRVAIYGTGEAAEVAFLVLRELGLDLEAVFDEEGGSKFLGFSVLSVREHTKVEYDVLIVARLDKAAAVVARLIELGVAKEKLLPLRSRVESTMVKSRKIRHGRPRMAKARTEHVQNEDEAKEMIDGKRR